MTARRSSSLYSARKLIKNLTNIEADYVAEKSPLVNQIIEFHRQIADAEPRNNNEGKLWALNAKIEILDKGVKEIDLHFQNQIKLVLRMNYEVTPLTVKLKEEYLKKYSGNQTSYSFPNIDSSNQEKKMDEHQEVDCGRADTLVNDAVEVVAYDSLVVQSDEKVQSSLEDSKANTTKSSLTKGNSEVPMNKGQSCGLNVEESFHGCIASPDKTPESSKDDPKQSGLLLQTSLPANGITETGTKESREHKPSYTVSLARIKTSRKLVSQQSKVTGVGISCRNVGMKRLKIVKIKRCTQPLKFEDKISEMQLLLQRQTVTYKKVRKKP